MFTRKTPPLLVVMLAALLLLQSCYRLAILVSYQFNKNYIIENFCVNKARPQLHCAGKCYLQKQLAKSEPEAFPAGSLKAQLELVWFYQSDAFLVDAPDLLYVLLPSIFSPSFHQNPSLVDVFHPPQTA